MEADAYRRLVLEHKDRLYGYAAYMLDDVDEAKDVTQESLVRLWQHRREIHDPSAARAWLMRTVHHLCVDRLRVRSGRPSIDPDVLSDLPTERDAGPERAAVSRELGHAITGALLDIPARDRGVLLMREVHGMTYAEMAISLGLPMGTLKALLHRAREKLRQRLIDAGVRP